MDKPDNAHAFVKFMERVWDMGCEPMDGGITLKASDLYDEWHNAKVAIRRCGAARTGGTQLNGENMEVYRFPKDEGRVSVLVELTGKACAISNYPYRGRNVD